MKLLELSHRQNCLFPLTYYHQPPHRFNFSQNCHHHQMNHLFISLNCFQPIRPPRLQHLAPATPRVKLILSMPLSALLIRPVQGFRTTNVKHGAIQKPIFSHNLRTLTIQARLYQSTCLGMAGIFIRRNSAKLDKK